MFNPELRRNLWLEISLHRLVMMPLLIVLIIAVTSFGIDGDGTTEVALVIGGIFILVTVIWGAKRVSDSVFEEQAERTWDWQRMSGVTPWSLTWGKWLGASVYPWYGGLIALVAYLSIVVSVGRPVDGVKSALLLILAALLLQSVAIVTALLAVRRGMVRSRLVGGTVLVFLLLYVALLPIGFPNDHSWHWFQWAVDTLDFWLVSGTLFVAWGTLGAYRLMREELHYRGMPGWWIAFLLFLCIYAGGFAESEELRWFDAFVVAALFTMGCALVEPKDPVAWRGTLAAWRRRDWRGVLEGVPLWLVSLGLALLVAFVFQLLPTLGRGLTGGHDVIRRTVLLCSLFLTRDVALLVYVSLASRPRRTEAATLLYLGVLYVPLPWLFEALGLKLVTSAFWPRSDIDGIVPLVVVAAEVVAMLVLVRLRWIQRVHGSSSRPSDS